jgi:hypothetical protein
VDAIATILAMVALLAIAAYDPLALPKGKR